MWNGGARRGAARGEQEKKGFKTPNNSPNAHRGCFNGALVSQHKFDGMHPK
jgi:hypothetical protein